MPKEAVQTSYRRGGEQTSLAVQVSRQTVKNKIYALEFPADDYVTEKKKTVDCLYNDADEDHVALQFREKKGDLIKAENGGKNNGLAAKIAYVYEGKENGPPKGGRRELKNCHYFCGTGSGKAEAGRERRDLGSSTESHVSHALSDRMSSGPKGWSRQGAEKMARLRVYYLNGGDMLELVRYQKKEKAEEEEKKELLSSAQIIRSEKNRRGDVGKYLESITHSVSEQVKKLAYFNEHIWGL